MVNKNSAGEHSKDKYTWFALFVLFILSTQGKTTILRLSQTTTTLYYLIWFFLLDVLCCTAWQPLGLIGNVSGEEGHQHQMSPQSEIDRWDKGQEIYGD